MNTPSLSPSIGGEDLGRKTERVEEINKQ